MSYYLRQKPKLVETIIKKKLYKIAQKTKNNKISNCYSNIKNIYNEYLSEHIYTILILVSISYFLYYRYNYKLKLEKEKQNKLKNIDIIPNFNYLYNV
jgi:hypothetical protein